MADAALPEIVLPLTGFAEVDSIVRKDDMWLSLQMTETWRTGVNPCDGWELPKRKPRST